jgi:hypothetical protein
MAKKEPAIKDLHEQHLRVAGRAASEIYKKIWENIEFSDVWYYYLGLHLKGGIN